MSLEAADMREGGPIDAAALLAFADSEHARQRPLRDAAVRDLLIPDAARLDDQRRSTVRHVLSRAVGDIVAAFGAPVDSDVVAIVEQRLGDDPSVAHELIDRVTLDLLNQALLADLVERTSAPATLNGAGLARLEAAEAHRQGGGGDLPAESYARLVWWSVAAIAGISPRSDRELADTAERLLATHDEGEGLESVAMRLAGSIDATGDALAELVDHCLVERRLTLLVALVANGLRFEFATVREMFVEPGDLRLWIALRALDLPHDSIARIGFALAEADHRRDVEAFADRLDAIMAVEPEQARMSLASLGLPRDYRAAMMDGGRS